MRESVLIVRLKTVESENRKRERGLTLATDGV